LLNNGKAPVKEPLLQEYIESSQDYLKATTSYQEAISDSDVSFVILPTPSDETGFFSNDYLIQAMNSIGEALKTKTNYHLVIITSTTMPGSTDSIIKQTLENASGRKVGENLGLCYSPEFIALGNVIHNMLNPDFVLIGESDKKAGDLLESIYLQMCDNQPLVKRMNFTNAELTKIAVNTFVTTKISYANMLSEYCDYLPDADVDVVTDAVGSDSRIGTKYLKGALGYGGPCFPRDNKAFSALGREIGAKSDLAEATDRINDHQVNRLFNKVKNLVSTSEPITILGLSYKPDTEVIEQSQGIMLANQLSEANYKVTVFDPMATHLNSSLSEHCNVAKSLGSAIEHAKLIIITTPWKEFTHIYSEKLSPDTIIIDPWSLIDAESFDEQVTVISLGRG
jgi:UDPglucose 6-dehydrogenase